MKKILESQDKPIIRLMPKNLKILLAFSDEFCSCHQLRLTADGILNHFEYDSIKLILSHRIPTKN